MNHPYKHGQIALLIVAATSFASLMAQTDVVTDWNITAGEIAVAAKLPPPPIHRVTAMVQSAVYEAVNAITKRLTFPFYEFGLYSCGFLVYPL